LQETQQSVIPVDIRGEIIYVSKSNLVNCKFSHILMEEANNFNSYGSNEQAIFVDCDKEVFQVILKLLRFFNKNLMLQDDVKTFRVFSYSESYESYFKQELKTFFVDDEVLKFIEFHYE